MSTRYILLTISSSSCEVPLVYQVYYLVWSLYRFGRLRIIILMLQMKTKSPRKKWQKGPDHKSKPDLGLGLLQPAFGYSSEAKISPHNFLFNLQDSVGFQTHRLELLCPGCLCHSDPICPL